MNNILLRLTDLLTPLRKLQKKETVIKVERSWSTDTSIGIKGSITTAKGAIDNLEVTVGNSTVPVTSWHELPLTVNKNRQNSTKGFWVQIPREAKHTATFKITQGDQTQTRKIHFKGSKPLPPKGFTSGSALFDEFIKKVNDDHLHVLEIGSRVLPPKKTGMRDKFPRAASYTGFDYYTDSNTDVVGDAHHLSEYFKEKKFDAVFSIAVLEHIAMPWVVALEINKILNKGGFSYHQVPFAWPAHELPWDFWRCSDAGLKILFPPSLGFETLDAGMYAPLRMYFDTPITGRERFPEFPCFGCSAILSQKTGEVDEKKFRWNIRQKEILGEESQYPKRV